MRPYALSFQVCKLYQDAWIGLLPALALARLQGSCPFEHVCKNAAFTSKDCNSHPWLAMTCSAKVLPGLDKVEESRATFSN